MTAPVQGLQLQEPPGVGPTTLWANPGSVPSLRASVGSVQALGSKRS